MRSSRLSWFSNIYLKTLRDYRIAILGWGVGIGALVGLVMAAVPSVLTNAATKASLTSLATSFKWLAEPVGLGTPGGYVTWKYGPTVLVLAIWPLLAGARMLRGEEERGSLDMLLSVPESRVQIALQKLAALWSALLAMGIIIALLVFLGGQSAKAGYGLGGALAFALNLMLTCGLFGSVALLLSQFTHERGTAAGITGGLLVLSIVVDMVHRVFPGTEWISRLSPVYYYNLSKPLIASYGTNLGALLVLLGLNLVFAAAAIALFAVRDVGGVVPLPAGLRPSERPVSLERALPQNAWSLRSVYNRSLARLLVPTFWWTVGIAGFAAFMVLVAQQTEHQLASLYQSSQFLKQFISRLGGSNAYTNATFLGSLFAFLPVLLMAFAVTGASSWAADEEEGRLEMVLAAPQSRLRVVLSRYGALATATILIGVLTLVATELASAATGIALDAGNVAAATLSMIPLGLLVAALGYFLSGWLRTAIDTGLLSILLAIWFVISFVGQDLSWPDAALRLSPLYYYGTPLLHGWYVGDILALLAVTVVALALASLRFVNKDIAR